MSKEGLQYLEKGLLAFPFTSMAVAWLAHSFYIKDRGQENVEGGKKAERIVTDKTAKNIMKSLQFVCINTQLQLHCKKNKTKKTPKNILNLKMV